MKRYNHPGFSLVEVLISLTLIGLIAVLALPMMITNVGKDRNVAMGSQVRAQLVQAYATYLKTSAPSDATTASDIVNKMNYVRKITDGAIAAGSCTNNSCIQVCTDAALCTPETAVTSPCTASHPCALMHNGGYLMYDADACFEGTGYNTNAVRFIFDPDGNGPSWGVTYILHFGGRLTTGAFKPATTLFDTDNVTHVGVDDLPNETFDPDFVWEWTGG